MEQLLVFVRSIFLVPLITFYEWMDARDVRHFLLPSGKSLAVELSSRLKEHSAVTTIKWSAACYGPMAIVTASLNGDRRRALAFDYYHGDKVLAGNPLASFLFPELKPRGVRYGNELDAVGPEALK